MNNVALLLVALGLACVAAAIVGGGLKFIGWIEVPVISSLRRQIVLGLFGAVVALGGFSQHTGSISAPKAANPAPNPAPIKIHQVHAQVPRCATIGGQGVVPPNKTLLLAVLGPDSKNYLFRTVIVGRNNWISRKVNIGWQGTPPGTHFTIYAILVDSATEEFLQETHVAGGIPALPPNFKKIDHIEVERGNDNTECK